MFAGTVKLACGVRMDERALSFTGMRKRWVARAVARLAVELSVWDESVASPHGEAPRHAMDAPAAQEGQQQVTACEMARKTSCVPFSLFALSKPRLHSLGGLR